MAGTKPTKYKAPDPEKDRIGNTIREYRKSEKIRQEGLAEMVGVSVNTIRNLENGVGNVSCETVFAVCRVLKIPADIMIYGSGHDKEEISEDFYNLDEEDKNDVLKTIKKLIKGCLLDTKYQKRV